MPEDSPFGVNTTRRLTSLDAEAELFKNYSPNKQGLIQLVDYMGGDQMVERVATAGHTASIFPENPENKDFLNYLSKKGITEPFSSVQLKFLIRSPIDTALALVYEPSCSVNEYSGRYSVMLDSSFRPNSEDIAAMIDPNNPKTEKRAKHIEEILNLSRKGILDRYKLLVDPENDLARELARTGLGTDNDTQYFWKIDLFSLSKFVKKQRSLLSPRDPSREYIETLAEIAKKVSPNAWNALLNSSTEDRLNLTYPIDDKVVDSPLNSSTWGESTTRRICVPTLEEKLFISTHLLDHGAIQALDYMGDDSSFAQAARTSYGAGTKKQSDDHALIRSLIRDAHTSPIEMAEFAVESKLPVFIDPRQAARHRTLDNHGFMGYTPKGSQFYSPPDTELKSQDRTNRQGRGLDLEIEKKQIIKELLDGSFRVQKKVTDMLRELNAPESLIRSQKGVGFYTKRWRTGDTHNWGHFIGLRADKHAQKEIRDYADEIVALQRAHTPIAAQAQMDYMRNAIKLSTKDQALLRALIEQGRLTPELNPDNPNTYSSVPGLLITKKDSSGNPLLDSQGNLIKELGREGQAAQAKLRKILGI